MGIQRKCRGATIETVSAIISAMWYPATRAVTVLVVALMTTFVVSTIMTAVPAGYFSVLCIRNSSMRFWWWLWPAIWLATIDTLINQNRKSNNFVANLLDSIAVFSYIVITRLILLTPASMTWLRTEDTAFFDLGNSSFVRTIWHHPEPLLANGVMILLGIACTTMLYFLIRLRTNNRTSLVLPIVYTNILLQQVSASFTNILLMIPVYCLAMCFTNLIMEISERVQLKSR